MQCNHSFKYTGKVIVYNDTLDRRIILAAEKYCDICNKKYFDDSRLTSDEYRAYENARRMIKENGGRSAIAYINEIRNGAELPERLYLSREEFISILQLAHTHYMRKLLNATTPV